MSMHGFINIRKEKGWTSHDVVARLRTVLKTKKIGHTGTLDPEVEGVLVVAVGNATTTIQYMEDQRKTYRAEIAFGMMTDTEDVHGRVLETRQIQEEELQMLPDVLREMTGEIEQVPPMYSAIKIKGQTLYKLARKGLEIDRPSRQINIYSNTLLSLPKYRDGCLRAEIELVCSKGTYVRTYIKDLSLKMGTIGVMSELMRTAVGQFTIENAKSIRQIEDCMQRADYSFLFPIDDVVPGIKVRIINQEAAKMALHGNSICIEDLEFVSHEPYDVDTLFLVYLPNQTWVGLGELRSDKDRTCIRMKKVFQQ